MKTLKRFFAWYINNCNNNYALSYPTGMLPLNLFNNR